MAYKERPLTQDEFNVAMDLRELVDRQERLHAAQRIAAMAEDARERMNNSLVAVLAALYPRVSWEENEQIRKSAWDTLHFPRYRFFDVALPNEGWAQFAEDREKTTT